VPKQTDIVDRLAPDSRVAVIRLRSLGDCVLSTPAIRLLRNYRPALKIAVVAEERFAGVFENSLPPSVRGGSTSSVPPGSTTRRFPPRRKRWE
jgi:hypothetical protein